jgi:photosystem II stability/assembly factor-like uncharacterized protein
MKYIVVLLIVASAPLLAQTGSWTQLHGPRGGEIEQVEAGADNTIYIRTTASLIFRSEAPFSDWQLVSIPSGIGSAFTLVTDKEHSLYLCVALPASGKETSYHGIYRSEDGGNSWTQVLSRRSINRIYRSPNGALYALRSAPFSFTTVFRSTDSGMKWDSILSFPFETMDMASAQNGRMYFTMRSEDKTILEYDLETDLFKSLIPASKANPNSLFTFITVAKGNPFVRYWDEGYIIEPNNNFERRSALKPFNAAIPDPLLSSADGTLYSVTSSAYNAGDLNIIYSTDQGVTWNIFSSVQTGINASDANIALDSAGNFYLGSKTGLYVTSDKGVSWQSIGLYELNATLMQEGPNGILFLHDSDFTPPYTHYRELVSKDGGLNWGSPSDLPSGSNGRLYRVSDGSFLYFNTVGYYTYVWHAPQSDPLDFKWLTNIGGLPYCAVAASDKFYILNSFYENALLTTSDEGTSWKPLAVPYATLPLGYLALSPNGSLYVGFSPDLYRSQDEGATWEQLKTGIVNSTITSIVFAGADSIILGTNGEGIWRSLDGGITWKRWDNHVRDSINILEIFGDRCYAATNRGLISCTMGSELWQKELFADEQFPVYCLLNYDNRKLFASVAGIGIWTEDIPLKIEAENRPKSNELQIIYDAGLQTANVEITLVEPDHITLSLYDLLGKSIVTFADRYTEENKIKIPISASSYPSGVYTLVLRTSKTATVEKLVLSR